MRLWSRLLLAAMAALCAALYSAPALASGDGGCYPVWTLEARERSCASRIVIGPGNDTRVNMLLLLRDRAELPVSGSVPEEDWRWLYDDYGKTFFDWGMLEAMLYPAEAESDADRSEFYGTRCQNVEAGGAQMLIAAGRNPQIGFAEWARLVEGRQALLALCRSGRTKLSASLARFATTPAFTSPQAREYGTYISGAAAFYSSDLDGAEASFASLRDAGDEWLRDTASYMEARTALREVSEGAADEWGYFDPAAANRESALSSGAAIEAYLATFPTGLYAQSARGLMRRAIWLQGNVRLTAEAYARALAEVDPASHAAARLIPEIDNVFLFAAGSHNATSDPLLLATLDLMRMRGPAELTDYPYGNYPTENEPPSLTVAELEGQRTAFADHPDLYAFVQANHAFYVTNDYRRVLQLLPDNAVRESHTSLQFSGQVLRGMALARLGDRNAVGFWRELIGSSAAALQRPTAELGLALAWEKAGQVDQVFAPGSPIADARIRRMLLEHAAGPEVLRAVASGSGRTSEERDLAGFVLLYRELRHGEYAAALRDMALMPADGPVTDYDPETYAPRLPTGVFAQGAVAGNYPCQSLRETTTRLARNPRDVAGRLCLGDFFRLNGFDYSHLDQSPPARALGGQADYPGDPAPRSRYYSDIIAERGVARDDRAYALYRAIRCYAPAGYSSCGGEEVDRAQRAAWFRRLKNEYGDTRWGQEAEYYW